MKVLNSMLEAQIQKWPESFLILDTILDNEVNKAEELAWLPTHLFAPWSQNTTP